MFAVGRSHVGLSSEHDKGLQINLFFWLSAILCFLARYRNGFREKPKTN